VNRTDRGSKLEFKAFEVELESKIPKSSKIKIKTTVYAIFMNKKAVKVEPYTVEDFNDSYALDFDLRFSESILLSYSDLVSSNFNVKILKYEFPKDILKVAELNEVEDLTSKEKYYVVSIYRKGKNYMFSREKTVKFRNKNDALDWINNIHIIE